MFDSLNNRFIVKLLFNVVKPLVVSPIRGWIYAENMMVIRRYTDQNGNKVVLIPSSTFKGVFRRIGNYVAKSMDFGNDIVNYLVNVHNELVPNKINHGEINYEIFKKVKENNPLINDQLDKDRESLVGSQNEWDEVSALVCPICTLFGSNFSRSKLWFYDSKLVFDENMLSIYHRVGIDRERGVSKDGSLYSVQVLPPGLNFEVTIVGNNLNVYEKLIFAKIIKYINILGLNIGVEKSRGLGLVSLDIEGSDVYYIDFNKGDNVKEKIRGFLAYFNKDENYRLSLRDFIEKLEKDFK